MSKPVCLQFSELYKGKIPGQTCFGNINIGREYICPNMGSKQQIQAPELGSWFATQSARKNTTCHAPLPQLGKNILCQKPMQTGGGNKTEYGCKALTKIVDLSKQHYTASGELVKNTGQFDSPGYVIDVEENIANRPVILSHNNTIPAKKKKTKKHNADRKFGCKQPIWERHCI